MAIKDESMKLALKTILETQWLLMGLFSDFPETQKEALRKIRTAVKALDEPNDPA